MQGLPAQLPHLRQLLQGMRALQSDVSEASTLSPPHERALARFHGLDGGSLRDGLIPWAAWERSQMPQRPPDDDAAITLAWAHVAPCHWAMGREQATLTDPEALGLTEDESRSLMAAMQPYFETDGITLDYVAPQRWLAEGEVFRGLPTASIDRVLGRSVDPWLPTATAATGSEVLASQARILRRLQNEMQMLLYTHPVNDARAGQRQAPVNSIWFSGTGDLPAPGRRPAPQLPQRISAPRDLVRAALGDDWAAYQQAWRHLDAGEVQGLLAHQRAGGLARLTLCGERGAQTFESAGRGLRHRIGQFFASPDLFGVLKAL